MWGIGLNINFSPQMKGHIREELKNKKTWEPFLDCLLNINAISAQIFRLDLNWLC